MDENTWRALIADMYYRTKRLTADAGRLGDDFLQYLYGLPLACLQEKAEHAGERDDIAVDA